MRTQWAQLFLLVAATVLCLCLITVSLQQDVVGADVGVVVVDVVVGLDIPTSSPMSNSAASTTAVLGVGRPGEKMTHKEETTKGVDVGLLNATYLSYLETLPPLPKKAHIFFPDKHYWSVEPILPFVNYSILNLMRLNPTWNVTVYDDDGVDRIISDGSRRGLISAEECEILIGGTGGGCRRNRHGDVDVDVDALHAKGDLRPAAHIVERTDIARVMLMYTTGGMYTDVDRLINVRLDNDVFRPNTRLCLPTYNNHNFAQSLMCSSPGNVLFLDMIRAASKYRMTRYKQGPLERRNGWANGGALFDMGPPIYNRAINRRVFNKDADERAWKPNKNGGGGPTLVDVRAAIQANTNGIVVTGTDGESRCTSSFLARNMPKSQCVGREDLYKRYDMKRWGVEVNALWKGESASTKRGNFTKPTKI